MPAFNWAVTIGDVVRVVLLFYLMPLWAVLLARLLLGERLTPAAPLRVVLALAGALVVLWPPKRRRAAAAHLAEGLGVLGGFSFALNNVMLRREARQPDGARALAMFVGGAAGGGRAGLLLAPPVARSPLPPPGAGLDRSAPWRWRCASWPATWRCSTAPRACRPTRPRW